MVQQTNGDEPRRCAPRSRCRNWRVCPTCARIRQATVADLAEKLAANAGRLNLTVLHPTHPGAAAVAAIRAAWVRQARPTGAIWTVEQGAAPGALHLNILHPSHQRAEPTGAACYSEPVRSSPRVVAAYISKRAGAPDPEIYPGRCLGRSGPLWQWLATDTTAPIVQAATLQHIIEPQNNRVPTVAASDGYRETAARWLPEFAEILAGNRPPRLVDNPQPPKPTPDPHPYERRITQPDTVPTLAEGIAAGRVWLADMRARLAASNPPRRQN